MRPARLVLALALITVPAHAQEIGHKILGTLGLNAGSQPSTGLYVTNRFLFYDASQLFGRSGTSLPVPFDVQAVADAVGIGGAYELPKLKTFVNAGVAVPIARVVGNLGDERGSIDRFGLSDFYVEPLGLGWRLPHFDLTTSYALYIPTQRVEPGGRGSGVSRGSWSHEFSLGGTVYFDNDRTWHFSALASYLRNQQKLGVDITRGSTVAIQGGAGKTLAGFVDVGLVSYALWQVTDDSGADLPPILRGARDQVYGLGGELDIAVRPAHCRLLFRYEHDLIVWSRPKGQIGIVGMSFNFLGAPR
jgi:hypothetical protein